MITQRIQEIHSALPKNVKLIAVSKTKPINDIIEAYKAGQRIFGENKAQEMLQKYNELPKDIEWHMIGHLQTNKVKYISHFVSLIHSVDSLKLLDVINKEGIKNNRIINCLLQIYIAQEETKFGLDENELKELLNSETYRNMSHVNICGFMGMATFTSNSNQIRNEFKSLNILFIKYKKSSLVKPELFNTLSMGMSDDYRIAIEEGSTMVRIGSHIFGERNYSKQL